MFRHVENVNHRWIANREAGLADTAMLLSQIHRDSGTVLESIVSRLALLTESQKAEILKNPAFLRLLRDLNASILEAYDEDSGPRAAHRPDLVRQVHSTAQSLFDLFAADTVLSGFPRFGWISLVHRPPGSLFDAGGEYGVEIDPDIDEEEWISTGQQALELIQLNRVCYELAQTFISYVVPLKQRSAVQNLSFSSRQLPNVIFKNNERSPFLWGETLVHEADHQFFYALEECYSFWNVDGESQKAAYYSPWRDDARPLDGILRGVSAFTRVADYYSAVVMSVDGSDADRIGRLLLQRVVECEEATRTLIESKQLSDAGGQYVSELCVVQTQADRAVQDRPGYGEWRAHSVSALNPRKEKWKRTSRAS